MNLAIASSPAQEARRILDAMHSGGRNSLESDLSRVRAARCGLIAPSSDEQERWDLLEGIIERLRSADSSTDESSDTCRRLLEHLDHAGDPPFPSPAPHADGVWRSPITNAFLLPTLTI